MAPSATHTRWPSVSRNSAARVGVAVTGMFVLCAKSSRAPVRERIRWSRTTLFDQVRNSRAPLHQAFQQALQLVLVTLQPSRRDALDRLIHYLFRKIPDAVEPRLEFGKATHGPVDQRAEIQALNRRLPQTPVGSVEYISIVHHLGHETQTRRFGG